MGGADTLIGGAGNDTLNGGADTDTASYTGSITASMITAGVGTWTLATGNGEGTDTLSDIEIVDGAEAGKILLVGNNGFDTLADALAAAADGDTIMLAEGIYDGGRHHQQVG